MAAADRFIVFVLAVARNLSFSSFFFALGGVKVEDLFYFCAVVYEGTTEIWVSWVPFNLVLEPCLVFSVLRILCAVKLLHKGEEQLLRAEAE